MGRSIGSKRRDCFDHVIALGESHLRRTMSRYASYDNAARTHLSQARMCRTSASSTSSFTLVASRDGAALARLLTRQYRARRTLTCRLRDKVSHDAISWGVAALACDTGSMKDAQRSGACRDA
jgi:hypothetical protein